MENVYTYVNNGELYKTEYFVGNDNISHASEGLYGKSDYVLTTKEPKNHMSMLGIKYDDEGNVKAVKKYALSMFAMQVEGVHAFTRYNTMTPPKEVLSICPLHLLNGYYETDSSFMEHYFAMTDTQQLQALSEAVGLPAPITEEQANDLKVDEDGIIFQASVKSFKNVVISVVYENDIPVRFKLYTSKKF